jgi:CheY-like chemotaxis protein
MNEREAPRILIADDEPAIRELVSDILSENGAVVVAEADGAAAVRRAALEPFDACVLDVEMPVLNGLDACRCLKTAAFTKDLPVLILTGRSDKETIDAAFAAGAWDFLAKPVHGQLLWRRITNMLTLATSARQARELEQLIDLARQPGNLGPPAP